NYGCAFSVKRNSRTRFLQEIVDEADLVNVFSVFEVISTLAFSSFVFVMSSITHVFGVIFSFWIVVICLLLACLLVFKKRKQIV
ncbi:MFS transporter, partial [Staphylococcus pseudintermedius]|nr:MFS transporter [Staphylococcus pseudintermedius]MDK3801339.1 MFS transporter [Staphylococcus pseudintermedius]